MSLLWQALVIHRFKRSPSTSHGHRFSEQRVGMTLPRPGAHAPAGPAARLVREPCERRGAALPAAPEAQPAAAAGSAPRRVRARLRPPVPARPGPRRPAHAWGLRACAQGRAGRSAAPVGPRLPPGVGGGASPPRPAVPCSAGRAAGSALRLVFPVWPRPRLWAAAAEARGRAGRGRGLSRPAAARCVAAAGSARGPHRCVGSELAPGASLGVGGRSRAPGRGFRRGSAPRVSERAGAASLPSCLGKRKLPEPLGQDGVAVPSAGPLVLSAICAVLCPLFILNNNTNNVS